MRQRGMHDGEHVQSVQEQPAGVQDTAGTSADNTRDVPTAPESPGSSDNDCIYLCCCHNDHHQDSDFVLHVHSDLHHHDGSYLGHGLVLDPRNQADFRV